MRGDLLLHGLGQKVRQVPAVPGLHRGGQCTADRLGVGAGAVAAYDLDAGMLTQPGFGHIGGAAGQYVDALAGLGVDEHGGVTAVAARREVVDPEHRGHRRPGQGIASKARTAVCRETAVPSAASTRAPARPANSRTTALTCPFSRRVRRW